MPNPYFQFKQFTVFHDRCAMKVGTDGVLLGAWTNIDCSTKVLDIGTGTGLIALMLAQRNNKVKIDAIDINKEAIKQAKENIKISPFTKQITCYHSSLQDFARVQNEKYDIIVSNPPFFKQSLKSPNENRTLARHTDSLLIEELLELSSYLLTEQGRLSIIYPSDDKDLILNIASENGLYISRITDVLPTPDSSPKRVLLEFCKTESTPSTDSLIIEKGRHIYSEDFTKLAKDFYLKL